MAFSPLFGAMFDDRVETAKHLESDLSAIEKWAKKWIVSFSPQKTKSLLISTKRDAHHNPGVQFMDSIIDEVENHKYLGLIFSNNLKWNTHIDTVCLKARKRLSVIQPLKFKLNRKSLETMYFSYILPVLEYGSVVWGGSCDVNISKLEKIHVDAMRLVTGATAGSNIHRLYTETGWLSVRSRIDNAMVIMLYKVRNELVPNYLCEILEPHYAEQIHYRLRNDNDIKLPFTRREAFRRSFFPSAIRLWNKLRPNERNAPSVSDLKMLLKKESVEKSILYYYGKRWASVHHARLRMQCSKLNYDLCCKLYVLDNPSCRCGEARETAFHYFLRCPLYNNIRDTLFNTVNEHTACNINTLLFGDPTLSIDVNKTIFDAVHSFIHDSERFI